MRWTAEKDPSMTDTDLTQTIQATALASMLESAHTTHELALCRGALSPRTLDAPQMETAALVSGVALHDLGWMRRVSVRGEDRFRWLSGMVTNMVADLPSNGGAWNLVLNAQGRIQGDLTVWREGEALELEIATDQLDRLLAHLNAYIIMDDEELAPLGGEPAGDAGSETAIGIAGPQSDEVLARLGLPRLTEPMTRAHVEWNGLDLWIARLADGLIPRYQFWTPASGLPRLWGGLRTAGAEPIGLATLEALRIAEGTPIYGIDMVERDLPQETSQMQALHFSKGCYLGQEIVERIRSRGSVHRHLRRLELSGPVPSNGTELTLPDGSPAGQITSAAQLQLPSGPRTFALAMIRGEAELRSQSLHYKSGTAAGTACILATPPTLLP